MEMLRTFWCFIRHGSDPGVYAMRERGDWHCKKCDAVRMRFRRDKPNELPNQVWPPKFTTHSLAEVHPDKVVTLKPSIFGVEQE